MVLQWATSSFRLQARINYFTKRLMNLHVEEAKKNQGKQTSTPETAYSKMVSPQARRDICQLPRRWPMSKPKLSPILREAFKIFSERPFKNPHRHPAGCVVAQVGGSGSSTVAVYDRNGIVELHYETVIEGDSLDEALERLACYDPPPRGLSSPIVIHHEGCRVARPGGPSSVHIIMDNTCEDEIDDD